MASGGWTMRSRDVAEGVIEIAVALTMLLLCIVILAASSLSPFGRSGRGGEPLGDGEADARRA
jgi:hypothetical protein